MYDMKALHEAKSVADAVRLLQEYPQAQIIAGGSDVLVQMREGKRAGAELISIYGLDELRGVTIEEDGTIRIGSLTSFSHITKDPVIQKYINVLGEAVDMVGGPQIRNIGTIGGNTCNGVTSADSASTLFAWDAVIELTGPEGVRRIPIKEFYIKAGKVDLRPGEIQTGILIPREAYEGYQGHYIKYAMRNAMDIATLGCSVNVKLSDDKKTFTDIRIAYGVAGPVPMRAVHAEETGRGLEVTEENIAKIGDTVLEDVTPRDSWRASKAFREHISKLLCKRALKEAVRRAGGMTAEEGSAAVTAKTSEQEDTGIVEKKEMQGSVSENRPETRLKTVSKAASKAVSGASRHTVMTDAESGKQYKLVRCRINGVERETMVDVRASLTDMLRNDYSLTSVKKGCEVGECGACNVMIDGECYNSCIYLAVWADGKEICTLEGLMGPNGELSDIQQAFIDEAAVQCGFCTPGVIMSAVEILESGKEYTRDELRKLLSGHLCRCTGYENILNAVEKTMKKRLGKL